MRRTAITLIALLAAAGAIHPAAATTDTRPARPGAVHVAGEPVLQLCRDWLMWDSCRQYGRGIIIPDLVRVGDSFVVAFASNAKRIRFTVAEILYADGECQLIRGSAPRNSHPDRPSDMLIVKDCRPVDLVTSPPAPSP